MSKREQEKAIEVTKKVAEEAKSVDDKRDGAQTAQEIQRTYLKSLDETKENVRKSIDETRNQIPRYTNVVKNYQEQALESTGKIVDDYIEAQKSIINSVSDAATPYYKNVNRIYRYWVLPRVPAEIWTRSISNIAENVSAAARITNDILFGNIEALRSAFERAQQHTEELSRINVNNAKTIANTAKETGSRIFSETKRSLTKTFHL